MLTYARGIEEVYPRVIAAILNYGKESSPRGFKTTELLGEQVKIEDARSCMLTNPSRSINPRFMVAEWLWIMGGHGEVELIAKYNSAIREFSDDGIVFAGAYGPRLATQWGYIIRSLQKPDSRQAVATIWTPNPAGSKDIPCTISIQFLIRDQKLNTIVTMRSSDVWLGLPYDIHNFAMIGNAVAGVLGVQVGFLLMQLGSLHLYERDYQGAHAVLASTRVIDSIRAPKLNGFPPDEVFMGKPFPPNPHLEMYRKVLDAPNKQVAWEVLRASLKA